MSEYQVSKIKAAEIDSIDGGKIVIGCHNSSEIEFGSATCPVAIAGNMDVQQFITFTEHDEGDIPDPPSGKSILFKKTGIDGIFMKGNGSQPQQLLNSIPSGSRIVDIQHITANNVISSSENNENYHDIHGLEFTANNNGTANYIILFNGTMKATNYYANIVTILSIDDVDQPDTEREQLAWYFHFNWNTMHYLTNLGNGSVVKLRWKKTKPTIGNYNIQYVSLQALHREMIIIGYE